MNSFFFVADSSCPVPRPAPELLEIVVKQREGNQNWRAKYIVATKVTRQDKFRQRPHHAVMSCARVWLGEIHTLTAPDGSARYVDSDGEEEPAPTGVAPAPASLNAAHAKGRGKPTGHNPGIKQGPGGLPVVPSSAASSSSDSQNGLMQNGQNSVVDLPQLPTVTAQQQQAMNNLANSMMPLGLNMNMSYPASIAPYMPLLTTVLTPQPIGANLNNPTQGRRSQAIGGRRLPVLPDLLICMRPIEEWGPQRAPVLFVQTHGGQEYLLVKHHATYVVDVGADHEVVSVRISMKNEKPKTLKVWKFDNSIQRPSIGQGQVDLEDISRSVPPGLVIPVIYPPGNGDSPFHVLHIDKELHPTLPTVVLHQLHEPQHLHTEQTFYITPLVKAQRKVRKVLMPPPPSKPSASKQQQIQSAAAGVISAFATGGNVHEASANLAATKAKKRGGKKKDDPLALLMHNIPGTLPLNVSAAAAAAAAAAAGGMHNHDSDSSDSEPAGLDGLGRKRKRKTVPPSVAARLKPTNPALIGANAAAAAAAAAQAQQNLFSDAFNPETLGLPAGMDVTAYYQQLLQKKPFEDSEDEEITDDEADDDDDKLKHESDKKRRRKKARLQSDLTTTPNPSLQQFIQSRDPKLLTRAVRVMWEEMKKLPNFEMWAYNKDQATNRKDGKILRMLTLGQMPMHALLQLDWNKISKQLDNVINPNELQALWKYASDHMVARKVVDLDELDLRSLWVKIDPTIMAAKHARKSFSTPGFPFPMFPMFPMFPNANKFPTAPTKPLTPAESEQLANFQKAMTAAAGASAAAGGATGVNPFLASMFMSMTPGMMANNAAAAAAAAAAGGNAAGVNPPTAGTTIDWVKQLSSGEGATSLFPFLLNNAAAAQQAAQQAAAAAAQAAANNANAAAAAAAAERKNEELNKMNE